MAAMTTSTVTQHQQQQQQQQPGDGSTSAAMGAPPPRHHQHHHHHHEHHHHHHGLEVLRVDPAALPPADAPDAQAARRLLLLPPAAVDLGPAACPHLHYRLPAAEEAGAAAAAAAAPAAAAAAACVAAPTAAAAAAAAAAWAGVRRAARLLQAGRPVALPTETVYGLAADALNPEAVARVFEAKGRPSDNPLIVHISSLEQLALLVERDGGRGETSGGGCGGSGDGQQQLQPGGGGGGGEGDDDGVAGLVPPAYRPLVAALWPGPLTLLFRASPNVPSSVTAGLPTVAVRMPAHPVARAVIAAAGAPLAAPSANASGRPSPTTAAHVVADLGRGHGSGANSSSSANSSSAKNGSSGGGGGGLVAAVVDGGACAGGLESTVLDGLRSPPAVLRPGGVPPELLELCPALAGLRVYKRDFEDAALELCPTTPGMKHRHYSPDAPVLLLDPTRAWQQQQQCSTAAQRELAAATDALLAELAAQGARVVLLRTCGGGGGNSSSDQAAAAAAVDAGRPQQGRAAGDDEATASGRSSSTRSSRSGGGGGGSSALVRTIDLGTWDDLAGVGRRLFGALRDADAALAEAAAAAAAAADRQQSSSSQATAAAAGAAAVIVVQGVPPAAVGVAIMNRLHKAASEQRLV